MKIDLESRFLHEVTMKRRAQMPNMEKLISGTSSKVSEGKYGEVLAPT